MKTHVSFALVAALAIISSPGSRCLAQSSVQLAAPQVSPAQAYAGLLHDQGEELVAAAQAMPADKYNFAPTAGTFQGVRTFAQQLKHIAQAQYFFFDGFGLKPDADVASIAKLTGKDEIIKALKDSYAFTNRAVETITPENAFTKIADKDGTDTRATIAAFDFAHSYDHYGQIVIYLRMNGIVPPASRK